MSTVQAVTARLRRHVPATLEEQLATLETALHEQLMRTVEANGVMRRYLEDNGLMDDFVAWQVMHWREHRKTG